MANDIANETESTPQTAAADEQQGTAVDVELLKEVIDVVRPSLQADGGDCNFVSVDKDGVVSLELTGACSGCPMSSVTLSMGIERILKEHVPGVTRVVPATSSMAPEPSPWGSSPQGWQEPLYGNDDDDIPTLL